MADRTVTTDLIARDRMSPEYDKAGKSATTAGDKIGKVAGRMGDALKVGAAAGVAGLVALGKGALDAASDAQQSVGATESVFKKSADTVITTSKNAAKQYGISANTYRENANLIGSLLKNQGVTVDQLAGKTQGLISTAADLSATYGGTTTEAVEALSSALKGEFDPLEAYGISLKQSTVNTEAMRVANVKTTSAFNKLSQAQQTQAKMQATTNIIAKQGADSQGAFAKETDTYAHKVQVLGAQWEDAKVKIGSVLLPTMTRLMGYLSDKLPAAIDNFSAGWNGMDLKTSGVAGAAGGLHTLIEDIGHMGDAFAGAQPQSQSFASSVSKDFQGITTEATKWVDAWNIGSARAKEYYQRAKQAAVDMTGGTKKEFMSMQTQINKSNTIKARAEIVELQHYIDHLKGKTVVTKADKKNIADSERKIDELRGKIARLQDKVVHVGTVFYQIGKGPGTYGNGLGVRLDGKARGGRVKRRPYLVGEEGPELMVPDGPGTIIPHQRTMQLAGSGRSGGGGGGGGGTHLHVHVTALAADSVGVARAVSSALQTAKQSGFRIPAGTFSDGAAF